MSGIKRLAVIPNKCKGCHRCELACSFRKFNIHSLFLAALHVSGSNVDSVAFVPSICIDCGRCIEACPVTGALHKDSKLGTIKVTKLCTGCGECITACPFNLIKINPDTKRAFKCEYCDGDPECVKHCPYHALVYIDEKRTHVLAFATRVLSK